MSLLQMTFLEMKLTHKVKRAVVIALPQEDFLEKRDCLLEVISLVFLILVEVQFAQAEVDNH